MQPRVYHHHHSNRLYQHRPENRRQQRHSATHQRRHPQRLRRPPHGRSSALAASRLGGAARARTARGLLLRSRRARNAPPPVELAAIAPRDVGNRAPDLGDVEVHGRGVEDAAGGGVVDELGRHAGLLGALADVVLEVDGRVVGVDAEARRQERLPLPRLLPRRREFFHHVRRDAGQVLRLQHQRAFGPADGLHGPRLRPPADSEGPHAGFLHHHFGEERAGRGADAVGELRGYGLADSWGTTGLEETYDDDVVLAERCLGEVGAVVVARDCDANAVPVTACN